MHTYTYIYIYIYVYVDVYLFLFTRMHVRAYAEMKTCSEFTELAKSRFLDCESCGMTQGAF